MRNARKWALAPTSLASDFAPVPVPTSPHPLAAQRANRKLARRVLIRRVQKGQIWALIAVRSSCKSVASQLLRTGSAGHGASRRVRSERAASRTARAEPSRRLCNGYNSLSAPSSADASKITVLKDHEQCTKWALAPTSLASDFAPVPVPTNPHPHSSQHTRGSPASFIREPTPCFAALLALHFLNNKSPARA